MSLLTPPSRRTRGLVVPGLDTKFSTEDMTTSIAYSGLHTPPQSANESRRPSLQSSWSDTPYSATGSGFACSLPSTPIHGIQHHYDDYVHGWHTPDVARSGSANRILSQHIGDSGFSSQAYHTVTGHALPPFSHAVPDTGISSFGLQFGPGLETNEALAHQTQNMGAFMLQPPFSGSELFPITHNIPSEPSFSGTPYHDSKSSLRAGSVNLDTHGGQALDDRAASHDSFYHHHPQIVVPSQLSPQDVYDHSQLGGYSSPASDNEILATSFASSATTMDSFEIVDPPSPMEMYFDHSEDNFYVKVKAEQHSHSRSVSPSVHATKSKRRSSRRARGTRRAWHRHETGGIEVRCEGKQFPLSGPAKHDTGGTVQMHRCTFVKNGEQCLAKFARSEHLKRHALSHTSDRPWPCPVEGCGKAVQRADNANQHFQSHLRPTKPGKRNGHVDVLVFRQALWETYDTARAQKMWSKIEKWIRAGMPDPSGRRESSKDLTYTIEEGLFSPVSPEL